MSLRRLRPRHAAAVAVLALAAAGCGSAEPGAPATEPGAAGEPIRVVASTDVYGSVAQAVGGDRVEVVSIIDQPGTDPHEYEATPADAAEVTGAALVIANGGGYDPFVAQLVEAAGGGAHLVDVYELSGFEEEAGAAEEEGAHAGEEEGAHAGEEEGAHAGEEEGAHGAANEHVWYSLPTMSMLADTIATELAEVSPEDAETFMANAATFDERIAELQAKVDAIRSDHADSRVAVTEPLPVYLLEAAGLQDVTPDAFAEAIEEGNDPPAAAVAEMLQLFEGDPVEVLVLNSQTQSAVTDSVRQTAQDAGVPVVEMGETLAEGTTDYTSWMEGQIDALAGALDQAA